MQVLRVELAPELEEGEALHQGSLGEAAAAGPDGFQEDAVKLGHFRLRHGPAALEGFFFEPVHHPGDVDAVGATGGAGFARRADPDGIAAQDLVLLSQQRQANHPVREKIHGKG